jgi:HNH endonuclease
MAKRRRRRRRRSDRERLVLFALVLLLAALAYDYWFVSVPLLVAGAAAFWYLRHRLAVKTPRRVHSGARTRREPIPERVRHEVWRRDQGRCVDCGSRTRLEYDHIIAVANGGSNTARNIELRCESCNRRKGAKI